MNTGFPKSETYYLKTDMFQDQEIPLTFRGWEKKGNEDQTFKGVTKTWKEQLKYQLRYSYPEFAIDEAGEKRLGADGQPFRNSNYDPQYPHGYSITYHFDEGQLTAGSFPLWNAFCMVQPSPGEKVLISKTGKDKETKWRLRKVSGIEATATNGLPSIQLENEYNSEDAPF